MTGSIVSVSPFRNRVSFKEAFEELELGEGKLSRPVLRGPGGRKAAWLLGNYDPSGAKFRLELISTHSIRACFDMATEINGVHMHGEDKAK